MNTPWFVDETLRDGIQSLGVSLALRERLEFLALLVKAGVQETIIGVPAQGSKEIEIIKKIIATKPNLRLTVWCRARQEDILAAQSTGAKSIHISFPASERLQKIYGRNQQEIIKDIVKYISLAQAHFEYISVGFQDASRTSYAQLTELITTVVRAQANRIRIADTVGILTPEKTRELIWFVKTLSPHLDIEFHAHNDYGLATANSITAIQAGATAVSFTINGIGERAGNVSLDELVLGLDHLYNIPSKIDLKLLVRLSKQVEAMTGCAVPYAKPISGRHIAQHTSGSHCHALLQDIHAYQPFDPALVGHKGTEIFLSVHSGRSAVRGFIKEKRLSFMQYLLERFLFAVMKIKFFPRIQFVIYATENPADAYHR